MLTSGLGHGLGCTSSFSGPIQRQRLIYHSLPSSRSVRRIYRSQRQRLTSCEVTSPQDYDEEKEASFKKRRDVYDFALWARHRRSNRYIRHLTSLAKSQITQGIVWPLIFEFWVSLGVSIYGTAQANGRLPPIFPPISVDLSVPFTLSSFALSLLLVFRTNASYGRFDEARKFWGGVVNRSRDFVRQAATWLDPVAERRQLDMLARWMAAFPWVMKCHLRAGEDLEADLKDILSPRELRYLLSTAHRPNAVLQTLSRVLHCTALPSDQRFRMDENLTFFSDMLGASERLLRTPLPLPYTRHTSRFLVLWLTLLPLILWQNAGWTTIPASVVIAFVLYAIDEIGVQIEEPFSILPLEAISLTITNNILAMMNEPLPASLPAARTAPTKGPSTSQNIAGWLEPALERDLQAWQRAGGAPSPSDKPSDKPTAAAPPAGQSAATSRRGRNGTPVREGSRVSSRSRLQSPLSRGEVAVEPWQGQEYKELQELLSKDQDPIITLGALRNQLAKTRERIRQVRDTVAQ